MKKSCVLLLAGLLLLSGCGGDNFDPTIHKCTMTCQERLDSGIAPFGGYPLFDRLCGKSLNNFCPECCLYWEDKISPCDAENESWSWVEVCADYRCECDMPRNQSLCDSVLELCQEQSLKLPKERVCLERGGVRG